MPTIRFEKPCRLCGRTLPLTEFPRNPSRRDGHGADCKACTAQTARDYRATPEGKAKSRDSRLRSLAHSIQAYDDAVARLSPAEQAALDWTPRSATP